MRKRHGGYVLLCALDELEHAGDDGDDETDGTEDLEESANAAKQGRGLGDLFACLARLCVNGVLCVSDTQRHGGAFDLERTQTHPVVSSQPLRQQQQPPPNPQRAP